MAIKELKNIIYENYYKLDFLKKFNERLEGKRFAIACN